MQQFRHILRGFGRARTFTAITLLILAVGIGATTAIFGVVNGVLLSPLPYSHPEELVAVKLSAPGIKRDDHRISEPDYFVYREHSRTLQDIGLYSTGITAGSLMVTITGSGEPERVPALRMTDGVLSILSVTPLLGRSFTRADDSPGSAATVMLSFGYWRDKFNGDRSVIDKTINVNGIPRSIIGVLPQHFRFLDETTPSVLLPMQLNRPKIYLGNYTYGAIARLKPGVSLAQANDDVARMLPMVLRGFPMPPGYSVSILEERRFTPNVRSLKQEVLGNVDKMLWILMASISLVLVVACANVAQLVLVRVQGRQQELAIRAALGASRGRIAAELFVENLTLAVLGGLLGLGLAYGILQVLIAMAPQALPRVGEIGIDGRVMLFTLAVSLTMSLLFGSAPAFKYATGLVGTGLRQGDRTMSESHKRRRFRGVLVVVQVALAVVLLVSSGLTIRTFHALTAVDPGFVAPSTVQTFRVFIAEAQVKEPERAARIYEEILHKLLALPSVSSVGISRSVPMDGSNWNSSFFVEGRSYAPGDFSRCRLNFVAPGFFKTVGTPILAGRDFTWSDIHNKTRVALVSESLAREYWHDAQSAVGKRIRRNPQGEWQQIVGVVRDVRQDGADKESPVSVYWPILIAISGGEDPSETVRRDVAFVIRSPRAGSEGLMNEARGAVWSVHSQLPVAQAHSLDYYYRRSMARSSFALVMLAIAAGMALLLGITGLYGMIAYSVSQRRREIGIRLALGAGAKDVLNMMMREGLKLTTLGIVIGSVAAVGLTHYLASLLFGVQATDPPTFVAVSVLLIAVALIASYVPARRAVRVDPLVALRYE